MSKQGVKTSRWQRLVSRARAYRISPAAYLGSSLVILAFGVFLGTRTDIWNTSLHALGFNVPAHRLDFSSVEATYEALAGNYDGTIDTSKLIDGANHGLVAAAGDQYTVYFNKSEAQSFSDDLNGAFTGIGAELSLKNSLPTVSSVLDGSPAKNGGLQAGDVITKVNGTATSGQTLDQVVTSIHGATGSKVTLTIVRGSTTKDYTLTRAALTNPSVTSTITNGIGILTISRFGDDTADLAQKAALSFKQANVKGVILDLRGNGGGEVDAAQSVTSLWLNNKIMITERRGSQIISTLRTDSDPVLNGLKTIVLVDGDSASASEITAAALRDNGAATLYGVQSFGKGSVQNVLDLSGGAELKVTIAHWYTPNGKNISKIGLTPGKIITTTAAQQNAGTDPVLDAAKLALQ